MKINKGTVLFLLTFFLATFHMLGQTQRAFVIGIGNYKDPNWKRINGDRDIPLVVEMLKKADFKHIQILKNSEATKSAIISGIQNLIKVCHTGDAVYIHFSGHGQQITDVSGDEMDGWDECWIPYDADMKRSVHYNGENHLSDDEINHLLSELSHKIGKNGKILVVVDACHSGDSSRGPKETYRGTADKFILSPPITPHKVPNETKDWIVLSACKDYQRNAELKTAKGQYGKLSYALYELMKNEKAYSNEELHHQLTIFFDKHRGLLQQTPLVEGNSSHFNIMNLLKPR